MPRNQEIFACVAVEFVTGNTVINVYEQGNNWKKKAKKKTTLYNLNMDLFATIGKLIRRLSFPDSRFDIFGDYWA